MSKDDIRQRLDDAIYEIERAKDYLEDKPEKFDNVQDMDVSKIIEWFESPFISEFDKISAIESHKRAKL